MIEQKQIRIMEVVPFNPEWSREYSNESERIWSIFNDEIVAMHHIGSTSIQGIFAKPVIDILIEVKDINNVDSFNKGMEGLGYIAKGESGIEGRRFFIKGLYNRTHHVHIFQQGNNEVTRHLNFRDYMIAHPEEARQYEDLKKKLAKEFRFDNVGYCEGKDSFIKEIDRKAEVWARKNK